MQTGAAVWVPASLVYLDTRASNRPGERSTHSLMYSGIATGQDRASAETGAIDELIERDATTVWWASRASTHELDDGGVIRGMFGETGPDVRLLEIPTDLPGRVVAAVIEDGDPQRDGLLAFGTACRTDPSSAARKAVMEAGSLVQANCPVWSSMTASSPTRPCIHATMPSGSPAARKWMWSESE